MQSPHSLATQSTHTASEWILTWTWPLMRVKKALPVQAWLNSVDGYTGSFRYYPRQPYDVSSLTGRTIVGGGFQYSKAILVAGWAANEASGLFDGQYMTVGEQLLQVTAASANADEQGRVTISFDPWLRTNFATGTAINLTAPFGVFRLSTSEGHAYTLTPDRLADFGTIEAAEVVS